MAIKFIDGFDNYLALADMRNTSFWGGSGAAGGSVTLAAGRFGGQAIQVASPIINGNAVFTPAATSTSFTIGFALNAGLPTTATVGARDNAGVTQVGFNITVTGLVTVYRNSTSNVLGTFSIPSYNSAAYYYIEFQSLISATVGTIAVNVEGVSLLSLTGQNTKGSGTTTSVTDFFWDNSSTVNVSKVDDFYYDDSATFHGPRRVRTGYPTSNNSVTWTPLSSTNVSQINETLMNSDTSYNSTTGVGNVDLFNTASYIGNAVTVDAVQIRAAFRKDDANAHTGATVLKSGATTSTGTALSLTTSYVYANDIYLTNPNTSSAWTAGNADAVIIGYDMVS
jgi:hypothetical protein